VQTQFKKWTNHISSKRNSATIQSRSYAKSSNKLMPASEPEPEDEEFEEIIASEITAEP
jgi:hypothetical protein